MKRISMTPSDRNIAQSPRNSVSAAVRQPVKAIIVKPVENLSAREPARPTTFQLAQLAAILATRPHSAQFPPADVVLEALQLWDAAFKVNLAEKQEREIWAALFIDNREHWEQRLREYVGDKTVLHELLCEPRFQVETEVLPRLFPRDAGTARTLRQKFSDLIHYAQAHQLFNTRENLLRPELRVIQTDRQTLQLQQSSSGEDLLPGKLNATSIRLLVEAQQIKTKEPAAVRKVA